MSKHKYQGEFEFHASKKMLYQYLSTASGLSQWFADDVNIDDDKNLNMVIDGEELKMKIESHKTNSFIKFVSMDEKDDPDYIEFSIDENGITEEIYVVVTEYSEMDDDDELEEIWENLMAKLKGIVGR